MTRISAAKIICIHNKLIQSQSPHKATHFCCSYVISFVSLTSSLADRLQRGSSFVFVQSKRRLLHKRFTRRKYFCYVTQRQTTFLRSTKENAFIVRSDFENFGPFIDTDLAPPKNSSGAKLFRENDVIFIGHVLNLVLRLSLLCLLNEVAMCFVSTRSSVSICLASWCASLFSLTFSSRLVYSLVEFWTLLPCLFYMFTITIA